MDQTLKCNHCYSDNTEKHIWGRTEYWVCKSCKKEVIESTQQSSIDYGIWNPKDYGYATTDYTLTLPEGFFANSDLKGKS